MAKFAMEYPDTSTMAGELRAFVESEAQRTGSRTVDLLPLCTTVERRRRILRALLVLYREFYWFYRDVGRLTFEFGNWPEFDDATGEITPDPRWRPLPKISNSTHKLRPTEFRVEPAKDTAVGDVYRFLLNNREPGTHEVDISTLIERHRTSKRVHRYFTQLRTFYGFTITPTMKRRVFVVERAPNRKISDKAITPVVAPLLLPAVCSLCGILMGGPPVPEGSSVACEDMDACDARVAAKKPHG